MQVAKGKTVALFFSFHTSSKTTHVKGECNTAVGVGAADVEADAVDRGALEAAACSAALALGAVMAGSGDLPTLQLLRGALAAHPLLLQQVSGSLHGASFRFICLCTPCRTSKPVCCRSCDMRHCVHSAHVIQLEYRV